MKDISTGVCAIRSGVTVTLQGMSQSLGIALRSLRASSWGRNDGPQVWFQMASIGQDPTPQVVHRLITETIHSDE